MPRKILLAGHRRAGDRRGFIAEGFEVDTAASLEDGIGMLAMRRYDAVIFAGPAGRSLEFLTALAELDGSAPLPILCLAEADSAAEIAILDQGASACLPPGLPFAELLARTRAQLHIAEGFPQHHRIGDLGIDPVARRASRGGRPLKLRPVEFALLLYLAERAGQVVGLAELSQAVWPGLPDARRRATVHICNLRREIESGAGRPLLHGRGKIGYILAAMQYDGGGRQAQRGREA